MLFFLISKKAHDKLVQNIATNYDHNEYKQYATSGDEDEKNKYIEKFIAKNKAITVDARYEIEKKFENKLTKETIKEYFKEKEKLYAVPWFVIYEKQELRDIVIDSIVTTDQKELRSASKILSNTMLTCANECKKLIINYNKNLDPYFEYNTDSTYFTFLNAYLNEEVDTQTGKTQNLHYMSMKELKRAIKLYAESYSSELLSDIFALDLLENPILLKWQKSIIMNFKNNIDNGKYAQEFDSTFNQGKAQYFRYFSNNCSLQDNNYQQIHYSKDSFLDIIDKFTQNDSTLQYKYIINGTTYHLEKVALGGMIINDIANMLSLYAADDPETIHRFEVNGDGQFNAVESDTLPNSIPHLDNTSRQNVFQRSTPFTRFSAAEFSSADESFLTTLTGYFTKVTEEEQESKLIKSRSKKVAQHYQAIQKNELRHGNGPSYHMVNTKTFWKNESKNLDLDKDKLFFYLSASMHCFWYTAYDRLFWMQVHSLSETFSKRKNNFGYAKSEFDTKSFAEAANSFIDAFVAYVDDELADTNTNAQKFSQKDSKKEKDHEENYVDTMLETTPDSKEILKKVAEVYNKKLQIESYIESLEELVKDRREKMNLPVYIHQKSKKQSQQPEVSFVVPQ